MPYVIPEDPFTRDMGKAVVSATESLTNSYAKTQERRKEFESNYKFARTLGVPDKEARQFAGSNPQQATSSAQEYMKQKQIPDLAEFFIDSLNVPPDSPQAQSLRDSTNFNTLMEKGKFIQKAQAENTPMKINKELRLQKDSMNTEYNRAVKDIQEGIRGGIIRDEKSARKSIQKLRKEQASNSKNITAGKELVSDAFQEYVDVFSEKPNIKDAPQEQPQQQEKIKFDPKNQEHMQIYKYAKQKAGGDKTKINKILSEIFEL